MKNKIHILLMINILLGSTALHCMIALRRTPRPVTGGISSAAAARLAAVKSQKPFLAPTVQSKSDTSTWGWLQSWFQGSQSTPVVSSRATAVRTSTSPFSPIQQSAFHTTVSTQQQQPSFWDTVTTFFQTKSMSPYDFGRYVDYLIKGEKKFRSTPLRDMYVYVFNDADLVYAKERIARNKKLINHTLREKYYNLRYSDVTPNSEKKSDAKPIILKEAVLDVILAKVFSDYSTWNAPESSLNRLKLAEYIINNGGNIKAENMPAYEDAYLNGIMRDYKNLYLELHSPLAAEKGDMRYKAELIKDLFEKLDPIIEKIMPDFREKLHKAQEERAAIEKYDEAYIKKIKEEEDRLRDERIRKIDKENRRNFLRAKIAWRESIEPTDVEMLANISLDEPEKHKEWDEEQYQRWLKTNSRSIFWDRKAREAFFGIGKKAKKNNYEKKSKEDHFNQETFSEWYGIDPQVQLLKTELGLSANASAIDVKKRWLAVAKLNHPDTRKPATATMTEEEYKNLSSLYSSVSEVLDKQAREEAAQRRKAAQQKAQQAKE
jgi:hypothetical protein